MHVFSISIYLLLSHACVHSKGIGSSELREVEDRAPAWPVLLVLPAASEVRLSLLDGFTSFYYKTFRQILALEFTSAFNSILQGNHIPKDTSHTHITVLLKPDNDLLLCASYRSISLLNTDLKLFMKILESRLLPYLERIIHLDQSGFVPGREARDNTIRALNLIHLCSSTLSSALLLFTDAEKAFDRVSWRFMRCTLQHIGIGTNVMK